MPSRMRSRASLAALAVLSVAVVPALVATPAVAAPLPTVAINEVDPSTDWIELTNTGAVAVDVSGFRVFDDKDDRTLAIPAGTTIEPGGSAPRNSTVWRR